MATTFDGDRAGEITRRLVDALTRIEKERKS